MKDGKKLLKELATKDVEDERKDGDELNEEEDTADECEQVCAGQVVEEVVGNTLLLERKGQGVEKTGVEKDHNDQRKSDCHVSSVVCRVLLVFENRKNAVVNEKCHQ